MTKARLTSHGLRGGRVRAPRARVAPATNEPREGVEIAEGETGVITEAGVAGKLCKSCSKAAEAGPEGVTEYTATVAPTGTAHLTAGDGTTLCGRSIDW